jgi:hypothetical protein
MSCCCDSTALLSHPRAMGSAYQTADANQGRCERARAGESLPPARNRSARSATDLLATLRDGGRTLMVQRTRLWTMAMATAALIGLPIIGTAQSHADARNRRPRNLRARLGASGHCTSGQNYTVHALAITGRAARHNRAPAPRVCSAIAADPVRSRRPVTGRRTTRG